MSSRAVAGVVGGAAGARGRKRAAPEAAAADSTAALVDAVTEQGGGLHGVDVRSLHGMGFGLVATRDLAAGAAVWRVPEAAMLTVDAALASPVGKAIASACAVVDAADGDAADGDAGEDAAWRAIWAAREAAWAREEAAEAAAAGGKRAKRVPRAADSDGEDAHCSSSGGFDDGDADAPVQPAVSRRSCLYAYLIAARAPDSTLPHAAYARSLPAEFTSPLLWPEADCAALEGTELARSVAVMRTHLREQYDALFPHMHAAAPRLFPRAHFTWPAWLWAHAAYSSRCFPRSFMPGGGDGRQSAAALEGDVEALDASEEGVMIPLQDIANHAPEGADIRWDAATGSAVLKRAVKAGEQVMSCYGQKDSHAMLLHYGFCAWDNPADAVPLRVAATFPPDAASGAAAERARGRKQHLFAQLAGGRMALQVTLRRGPLPPLLLAAARVCCLSAAEAATQRGDVAAALTGPLSAANEQAAAQYIKQMLDRRVVALLRGEAADAWAARVAAARAADAVRCRSGSAEVAVTRAGAVLAYRDGVLRVLQHALDAL